MIYLDSAAAVKLAHAELESPALRSWLDERAETGWVSSVLTEIESFRALARYAPDAISRLPAVLDQIDLIELTPSIRVLARRAKPVTVRSMDAIHLGMALYWLTSFVTYDKRLLEAAKATGLPVDSPTQQPPATPQPGEPAQY
jgi:predicted nucleic acid-binding protein